MYRDIFGCSKFSSVTTMLVELLGLHVFNTCIMLLLALVTDKLLYKQPCQVCSIAAVEIVHVVL